MESRIATPARARWLAVFAVVLLVAACGSAASPSPSAQATTPATGGPSTAATPTADPAAGCKAAPLKAGHDSSEAHPYQAGLTAFATAVKASTDGRVTVEIFPNAQLGDEQKMVEGLKLGTLDMAVSSTAPLTSFSKKIGLLDLPFLTKDLAQNYRMLDGEVGKVLSAELVGPTGGTVIAWYYVGQRNTWNSKRPINTPADLSGLKIRTQQSPVQIATFNAFGAQAVPMSFSELYQALQTGVVDGADNDPVDVLVEKFYEVTKYYSFTGHRYINAALIISTATFNGLCKHDQDAVLAASVEGQKAERAAEEGLVSDAVTKLKGFGIVFNDVADKAAFQAKVESVYTQFEAEIGADLIAKAKGS